jgi:hypothetical protein
MGNYHEVRSGVEIPQRRHPLDARNRGCIRQIDQDATLGRNGGKQLATVTAEIDRTGHSAAEPAVTKEACCKLDAIVDGV